MPDDYWFFLSHARRDALGEEYVRRFFDDLARRVGQIAGLPSDMPNQSIGFGDFSGLEPGDRWPDRLTEALQASRTLVCLYSPAYFNSDYCGRELRVFLDRVDAVPGSRPSVILPVLWEGADRLPRELPAELASIQHGAGDFGDAYDRGGAHWLISLEANRDDYRTFIDGFALRIVEQARPDSVPRLANVPPLDQVTSVFGRRSRTDAPASFGPGTGVFVFVAAADAEARQVRSGVDAYGRTGGREWRPWFPNMERPVGVVSQTVASLENLFYETLTVDDALLDRLRSAEETNAIVMIVVDPWTIQLEPYRSHMLEFDQRAFVNCALLVPWNESDPETAAAQDRLATAVRRTFSRYFVLSSTQLREIRSADELQHTLIAAIGDVRRRILQRAEVFRDVDTSVSLPMISGPGGAAP